MSLAAGSPVELKRPAAGGGVCLWRRPRRAAAAPLAGAPLAPPTPFHPLSTSNNGRSAAGSGFSFSRGALPSATTRSFCAGDSGGTHQSAGPIFPAVTFFLFPSEWADGEQGSHGVHQLSDTTFHPSAAPDTADYLKSGTKLKSREQMFDNTQRSITDLKGVEQNGGDKS